MYSYRFMALTARWLLTRGGFLFGLMLVMALWLPDQIRAEDLPKLPSSALADEKPTNKVVVMSIKGSISRNLLQKVKDNIAQVQGDPVPAGLIVLIDSKGGDGFAAMQIGRMLRARKAHVFVSGDCASACVFILASGVVRGASAYSVGIHQGRVTISDDNAKVIREVDLAKEPKAQQALERFERASVEYFAQMGISSQFYPTMRSHKYKGVHRLNHEELVSFGLIGFENSYLAERSAFYERQTGAYRMDQDELRRRTLRVGGQCAIQARHQNEFVQCYKEILKDPY